MRRIRKGIPFLFALSLLTLLFFPFQSSQQQGPTRYVNNTDPTCGGKSPCYTTIQAAVNASLPGDTIQIQAGTYAEKVSISGKNNSTTASESDRIVIEADSLSPPGSVVVAGASHQCADGAAIQLKRSKFITIRGLIITGAGGPAISLVGGGINKNQAIHIERNRVFDNGSSECDGGITVVQQNPGTLIVNNLIYDNGGNGISLISADEGSLYIVNNAIHTNHWNGVRVVQSREVFIVNNIITQNGAADGATGGRYGLLREGPPKLQPQEIHLLNNLICGNRLAEVKDPVLDSTDSGNLTPQGTEGAGVSASSGCEVPANVYANLNGPDNLPNSADDDFRLKSGSPAIDRGMDPRALGLNALFNALFESDFSTEAIRPSDSNADRVVAFDIGAFEFPNEPPIANAGPDQSVFTGTLVTLNGTQSSLPEGATLTFQWTIVSQPAGSSVALSDPASVAPRFTPAVAGDYLIQLVVNDGQFDSAADTVTVTARVNSPPTANAGGPYAGTVGVPIQFSGTGTDPDGDPVTFSWNFGDGGTASGPTPTRTYTTTGTFTVTLTVTDSFGAFSTSQTSATVSQALVLNPIGNKTVNLGETLTFTVSATSSSGAVSLFVSPLPLPNHATFNAVTGLFTFTPDTTQVGSFQLTFSAVSDNQTVSETITITVPQPPPGGITAVKGRVYNLNNTPLKNVKVTLKSSGHTEHSTDDGFFTLSGIPHGRQELIINGREANFGVFAILAVPVNLIEGVLNNLPNIITIPDVDVAAEVQVSSVFTTVVSNPSVPGVELAIPGGTAKNSDGTAFTGKLSINPVPDYGRPESRPEELRPGMAVTIQPAGVRFNPPAPLTFPNADGMPVGSELNLWSLSPDTGTFSIVGKGLVTQDGLSIVTTEGGVSASAWHFFLAPSGSSNTDVDESEGLNQDPTKQCAPLVSSTVALQNGCLGVEFSLPSYRSLGVSRPVKFIYKSNRANPQPVIPFNATIPVRAAVPPRLSYSLSVGGAEQGIETFINTSDLDEGRDETIRAVASFDASQLKSGVYPYRIKLTSNYLNSAISSFISDRVLVVNEQKSSFGAGWGIEGVGRLHLNADGSALLTDGNGSALTFRREILGQVSWWPGDGDANDIAGANHGTLQNGATFAAGKVGKAFSLDGVDDYVQVAHNPNLDPGAGSFTIAAWVKTTSTGSQVVVSKYECGQFCPSNVANSLYFLTVGLGKAGAFLRDTDAGGPPEMSEGQFLEGVRFIADGNFHHIAMVRHIASQQLRLYVDGVLDASAPLNAGASGVLKDDDGEPDPFLIGASIIGGQTTKTSFFSGLIDEVQFYNRALSASEIQTIFTSPGKPLLAGNFTTPAGDFSTLVKNSDDTFTRKLKDGAKINFNAQGLQTSVVDRNGNTTSYSYDGSGRLLSMTDPAGLVTIVTYAGSLLSSVTDPGGRRTSFQHDGGDNLTRVTFPTGSFKSFGYDSKHLMTTETDERGSLARREYDGVGRLVRATLPDGTVRSATNAQTVGFADPATGIGTITNPAPVVRPSSALSTFTDGGGNQQTVKIGKFGAPQRITDPLGQTTVIERGIGNNGTLRGGAAFAPGQVGQAFSFDGVDDFVEIFGTYGGGPELTIEAWVKTSTTREDFQAIVSSIVQGEFAHLQLFNIGNIVVYVDMPPGGIVLPIISQTPTSVWRHIAVSAKSGNTRLYVDGNEVGFSNHIFSIVSPTSVIRIGSGFQGGRFFKGEIDEVEIYNRALSAQEVQSIFQAGRSGNRAIPLPGLVSRWQGEGDATDSTGGSGLPTKITRPNGAVMTMTYDSKGNLLTSTDPVGGSSTFTYEPSFNQVTSIRDPRGNSTTISYDAKGNPTQIRDSQANVTQMTYDARGLLTSVTSAVGTPQANTTSFTYDAKGNLITTTDPKGNITTLAYDSAGNVFRSTDSEGRVTEFSYDGFNRLVSVIDHNNNVTHYSYDAKGNLTQVIDARNQTTTFIYDALDRLISATNPSGFTESFAYDANGNLVSTSNRNGPTITFDYDALNRLLRKTLPGNQVTTFSYDSVGNLTFVIDPDSTVTMTYDLANRLTSTTTSSPSVPAKTIAYQYDLNGNRLAMTDPQGGVTSYAYDSVNRLTSVNNPAARATSFAYDALGRRTSMTHGNGVVTTYSYDAASQLLSLVHQLGAANINSFSYTYDRVGNRTAKTDRNGTANYTYDTLNRLVQATNPLPSNPLESYTYDPVGNRTNSNQNGASTFNQANQLTEDASFTYQYDNNGNLTRKTAKVGGAITSYEYDAENKLVRVVSNGTVVNYKYDGLGRRVEKEIISASTTVTRYVYDNEDILLELDGSNNITARYTHGPGIDEPLVMEKGGASFFYHADGLGSITEITDTAGVVKQAYTYSSFGKIEFQLDPNFIQPYTFTAREFDPETGLYFYRTRTLDPGTGRFNQEDPFNLKNLRIVTQTLPIQFNTHRLLRNPDLQTQFAYIGNNPINFVDPLGLWSVSLEGYWGWGGGIVFGRNPNGTNFLTVKFGYGFGGGGAFDPFGTSPGFNPCINPELSSGFGGFAELGVGLGPFAAGVAGEGGVNSGIKKSGEGFLQTYSKASPQFSIDAGLKLRAMAATGVQVNFVGF